MNIVEKHILGWRVIDRSPAINHCVVCLAPHTSNWDFIVGMMACQQLGRQIHYMMKQEWFVGPLSPLFKRLGGIPIDRSQPNGITEHLIDIFNSTDNYTLVITPEGTRSANANWKSGFYRIAQAAHVPLLLAYIDYEKKEVGISEPYIISGNIDQDIADIKHYFTHFVGKNPHDFAV